MRLQTGKKSLSTEGLRKASQRRTLGRGQLHLSGSDNLHERLGFARGQGVAWIQTRFAATPVSHPRCQEGDNIFAHSVFWQAWAMGCGL